MKINNTFIQFSSSGRTPNRYKTEYLFYKTRPIDKADYDVDIVDKNTGEIVGQLTPTGHLPLNLVKYWRLYDRLENGRLAPIPYTGALTMEQVHEFINMRTGDKITHVMAYPRKSAKMKGDDL